MPDNYYMNTDYINIYQNYSYRVLNCNSILNIIIQIKNSPVFEEKLFFHFQVEGTTMISNNIFTLSDLQVSLALNH